MTFSYSTPSLGAPFGSEEDLTLTCVISYVFVISVALWSIQPGVGWRRWLPPTIPSEVVKVSWQAGAEPPTLGELYKASEAIVVARIGPRRFVNHGTDTNYHSYTELDVVVTSVIKGDDLAKEAGARFRVLQPGGVAEVDGRRVRIEYTQFPPLVEGESYVLCLTWWRAMMAYQLWHGRSSAILVRNGKVWDLPPRFGASIKSGATLSEFAAVLKGKAR